MTKETTKTATTGLQINSILDLQSNYRQLADQHLAQRFTDNPEFKKEYIKTFSDLVFSQDDEMLEKLPLMRQNTLLNAVFKATEAKASFAKREVSLIPFKIWKKEVVKGVETKVDTGQFTALVILDINFQKQQILKLDNCKKFFTAEVHEGVSVMENLQTGNIDFEGNNDVTKPTVGYYACFITTEGEKYDRFMSNATIIERAKFSPGYDAKKYTSASSNIHFEKIVVRNLIKEIPILSNELKSVLGVDEDYSDYQEVHEAIEAPKVNRLEEAKKEMAKEVEVEEVVEAKKAKASTSKVKEVKEAQAAQAQAAEVKTEEAFF